MKLSEVPMFIYQYAYYQMIKWDERMWAGKSKTQMVPTEIKPPIVLGIIGIQLGFSLDFIVTRLICNRPMYLPYNPLLFFAIFGLALTFLNYLMLRSKRRNEHYHRGFAGLDKQKQARWNFYLISIGVLSLVSCLLATLENN